MGFKKLTAPKYPVRHWALIGRAQDGKSTLLAQLAQPLLVVDADQRFDQIMRTAPQMEAFALSENRGDNCDVRRIDALLSQHMPGSGIRTIAVDSLTPIISPLVQRGLMANRDGEKKNKADSWQEKAAAMKLFMDTVNRWGCDTIYVWHQEDGRDDKGNSQTKETVPPVERERLFRCLDVKLVLVRDGDARGVLVEWARSGRFGMTLWDEPGNMWRGMPERIEEAIYAPDPASGKPFFPNAELVMHADEWAHWHDDARMAQAPEMMRIRYFPSARQQAAPYRDRLRLHRGGEVFPGVTAMPLQGHTPGHTGYMVASGTETLFIWGDIVHVPEVQIPRPEVAIEFDTDSAAAIATRRRVLDMVATDRLLIAGMHMHFPGYAHIMRAPEGYRMVPEAWRQAL